MLNKYGAKDGSRKGKKQGGGRRNKVSPSNCRHPKTKNRRTQNK